MFACFEPFLFQPLTNGQVVEPVSTIGHEDGKDDDADGYEDMHAEGRILMSFCPRHLHVDEWIMGDVEWIGNVTEELVDGC